jgi:hypothetical protein
MADSRNLGRSEYRENQINTTPVLRLVQDVLRTKFSPPYPEDITEQVCLAIEGNPQWLRQYETLVADAISRKPDTGLDVINNSIGRWVKKEAGMVTVKQGVKSKSGIIKTYSRLGHGG